MDVGSRTLAPVYLNSQDQGKDKQQSICLTLYTYLIKKSGIYQNLLVNTTLFDYYNFPFIIHFRNPIIQT